MRAIVVDVRSYGLVVELPDCLVTGLIHVSSLPDDFYEFDSTRLSFVGRRTRKIYKIGDVLKVIVSRVDAYKRQIDFVPVGSVAPATEVSRRPSDGQRPGQKSNRGQRSEFFRKKESAPRRRRK